MTELIVVRHGETDFNRQLRFQGQVDVPLNAAGEAQARALAQRMAAEPQAFAVDLVLSSDLQRAARTAALCAPALGQAVRHAPLWREQGFGVLEGLNRDEITRLHPEQWAAWLRHRADHAPPGGESVRQFHARVMQALGEAVAACPGGRVLVFAHGGVLDMLWRQAHGLPLDGDRECAIPNTGVNRLRWHDGGVLAVVGWADDAHLRP